MKHFKLFFACALMSLLSLGQVWAGEVSITPSQALNDGGVSPIATSCAKGDGTSNPAISSGELRLYQAGSGKTTGNTISFSSTYSITKIVFDFTSGKTASNGSFSEGSYDDATMTWTGSATSLTLTVTGTTSGTRIYIKGMTVTYDDGGGTQTCATPSFSPAAGSYEGTQNVTISSTAGATIYYTTDGTTPSTTSSVYSTPIAVAADMTIKAYAVKSEYNDSEVAEAAYTITEGPDVILDFTDNTEWAFPTSNTLDEGTFSDGTYTVKVKGEGTGKGYKFSSGKLLIGQNGAYILLPEFANPIARIVCPGVSGASGSVKWNVYDGETAVSTEVTGCTSDVTFEIDPQEANKQYKIKLNSAHNLQISHIKIYYGTAPAVAKPTISGDENFVGSTTVTITHADADAIYYTTDGSDPKTSGTKQTYSVPFTVNADGTTTVKAYAVKGSDESDVASKTFTKVTPMTTAAALRSFATASAQNAFIQLDGWKVTFVNGNNAYMIDPSNEGVILNNASHGYVAGDELNDEVVEASVKLASGRVQLSGFTSTNITATSGTATAAEIADFSTLTLAHQSRLVTLKDATYASSTSTFSDGVNSIYYYDQFSANPTLVDGATYDVTGIVIYYKSGTTEKVQIAPREATDVVSKGAVVIPTAASLAALKAASRGTYIVTLTDAVVTYVNGKNVFIEEGTTGALIFLNTHSYVAGNCLNGEYQVTTEDYQGKFEITAIEAQAGAATTTAAIPLTTLTITQLNADFAAYESRRIKIEGVNVTDALTTSDRNGQISDGVNTVALYAGVASTVAVDLNANIDIIGYPGFHNTDEQLTVWANEDITVNVKDDPELSYSPASVNLTVGDALSAPTFNNPHTLSPITYSTDNDAVATVDEYGAIALAGGTGTAVITASYAGDATYAAGNATFTITVSAYDPRKLATGSAFTDISGDLTPNDITYAAYKGDGTSNPVVRSGDDPVTIRIYKPATGKTTGGYLTVTAIAGCTIDQVQITFSGSATAAYSINDAELPTDAYITGEDVLLTPTALNAQSVSIVNLKNGSIDIAEIKVWYNGEGLPDPELSYSPASDEITLGDAWSAPTFNNPHSVTITSYASDNEAVATVTDGGVIALAGGTGTANITASFDGNASYKAGSATYTIIVNAPAPVLTGTTYTKVTSTGDITDGEYLIVYETENVAFNGDLATLDAAHNTVDVVISGSEIAGTADIDAAVFTLDVANGTIQAHNGNYIGVTTYGNGLKQNAEVTTYPAHTFEIDGEGNAIISIYGDTWNSGGEGYMILNYNDGASDKRFRYYKAGSQKKIQLYKKDVVTPPSKEVIRDGLSNGKWGTLCPKQTVENVEGATFYQIAYLEEQAGLPYNMVWDAISGTTLEAGKPYFFIANATEIRGNKTGAELDAAGAGVNGFYGYIGTSSWELPYVADYDPAQDNTFVIYKNEVLRINAAGTMLRSERCYININATEPTRAGVAPMPGRDRIRMSIAGVSVVTGMEEITNDQSQMTNKVIIDGHLYILRGEKMYDTTGRMVK